MREWIDECFEDNFVSSALTFLPSIGFFIGLYWSVNLMLYDGLAWKEQLASVGALLFCLFGLQFIQAVYKEDKRTLKQVLLGNQRIFGSCYYKTQFIIDFQEIRHLTESKLSFFMKQMRLFQGPAKGFDIELKNGKIYHVSPHMSNLEALKQVLVEGLKQHSEL